MNLKNYCGMGATLLGVLGQGIAFADGLPSTPFYATIQNSVLNQCLIMGGNGNDKFPSRFLWGNGSSASNCGLSSQQELLDNKQAVWKFVPIQGNQYVITNSANGKEECLIFSGNGRDLYPSRFLWGNGSSVDHCGFSSQQELLSNKQAIWTVEPISGTQYTIKNSSSGSPECLIISGNGSDRYPSRYLWGNGSTANFCGFSGPQELLTSKEAVWNIQPILPSTYTLTATPPVNNSGSITSTYFACSTGQMCSTPVKAGTSVGLEAAPYPGYVFASWGGDCAGQGQRCTLTMDRNHTVSATFNSIGTATLTITPPADGLIQTSSGSLYCGIVANYPRTQCSLTVSKGTQISLLAFPNDGGHALSAWSGACAGVGSVASSGTGSCNLTLNSNMTVSGVFSATVGQTYTLTATPPVNNSGSITSAYFACSTGQMCSTPVKAGTSVGLEAAPYPGYEFASWGGDCAGQGQRCTLTMDRNHTVSATFNSIGTATLTITPPADGLIQTSSGSLYCGIVANYPRTQCSLTVTKGTQIGLLAFPNDGGHALSAWSGACAGVGSVASSGTGSCNLTLNSNMTVSGVFSAIH